MTTDELEQLEAFTQVIREHADEHGRSSTPEFLTCTLWEAGFRRAP